MVLRKIKSLYKYSTNRSLFAFFLFIIALAFFVEFGTQFFSPFALAAIPIAIICLFSMWRPYYGLFVAFMYSVAMYTAIRLFPGYPFGIFFDLLLLSSIAGIIIRKVYLKSHADIPKRLILNPITIALIVWIGYNLVQCLNPANLSLEVTIATARLFTSYFLLFSLGILLFTNRKRIIHFTTFWLSIAVVCAIYAFWQKYSGFYDFEIAWMYSHPKLLGLIFVDGNFRLWSLLGGVSSFGMFMAYATIVSIIFILGKSKTRSKLILVTTVPIFIPAMLLSGSRTAFIMVAVGLGLYFLLTLNNLKTLIFGVLGVAFLIAVLFGPFYTGTIFRLRSAFFLQNNESMSTRNLNRKLIQPYILEHPLGSGHLSTGENGIKFSPGHPLAGFPPDNGYLRTVLETGIPGLLIELGLYVTFIVFSIRCYFRCRDPEQQTIIAAYCCSFFAATVALYTQQNVFSQPMGLLLICSIGMILNVRYGFKE